MKGTNIYFVNGPDLAEINDFGGYYDYEEREFKISNAKHDETQFDTTDRTELAELWFEFCIDEGIITGYEEVEVEE